MLEAELAASKDLVQRLSVDSHAATRLAREAEALEAQTRSQREADRARIADLNKCAALLCAVSTHLSPLGCAPHPL